MKIQIAVSFEIRLYSNFISWYLVTVQLLGVFRLLPDLIRSAATQLGIRNSVICQMYSFESLSHEPTLSVISCFSLSFRPDLFNSGH